MVLRSNSLAAVITNPGLYRDYSDYIGIMENEMETTILIS